MTLMYSAAPTWNDLIADLENFGYSVTETIGKRYIHPENQNIPSYHEKVHGLSRATKQKSVDLHQTNAQLQQMKSNLHVMLHNSAHLKAEERRSVIAFWTMLALYVALLLLLAGLFATRMHAGVYVMAGVVISAVLLWIVVRATRGESRPGKEAASSSK